MKYETKDGAFSVNVVRPAANTVAVELTSDGAGFTLGFWREDIEEIIGLMRRAQEHLPARKDAQ